MSDDPKRYQDEEWLREQYVDQRQSSHQIAADLDVSHVTVLRWLERHGIARRPPRRSSDYWDEPYRRAYRDPEYLRAAYWRRGQTIAEIAAVCGVGTTTIIRWMDRHEIPRRDDIATRMSR